MDGALEQQEREALDAYSRTVVAVAERLAPSVANLRVTRRTRRGRMPVGGGSAVVLTPDGFLLTSAHVVAAPGSGGRGPGTGGADQRGHAPDRRVPDDRRARAARLSRHRRRP